VRRVIPDDGRLLLVEEVVAPPNEPGGKVTDLLMAAVGGRERTEQASVSTAADAVINVVGAARQVASAAENLDDLNVRWKQLLTLFDEVIGSSSPRREVS
jgi:hypothetical protein